MPNKLKNNPNDQGHSPGLSDKLGTYDVRDIYKSIRPILYKQIKKQDLILLCLIVCHGNPKAKSKALMELISSGRRTTNRTSGKGFNNFIAWQDDQMRTIIQGLLELSIVMTVSTNNPKLIYEDVFLEEVFVKKGVNIVDWSELENLLS